MKEIIFVRCRSRLISAMIQKPDYFLPNSLRYDPLPPFFFFFFFCSPCEWSAMDSGCLSLAKIIALTSCSEAGQSPAVPIRCHTESSANSRAHSHPPTHARSPSCSHSKHSLMEQPPQLLKDQENLAEDDHCGL